jgi:hypothetical protein
MATPVSLAQNFSTTLNVGGGIDASQTAGIVLTSVANLPTDGGILCFDWAATLNISSAEYIEYTGISGSELTGVTRGAEGVAAKPHTNGCTVVGIISKAHINRLKDKLTGNDATAIQDPHGNEILKVAHNDSAVNEITVTNAITTAGPTISATGGDTNIDINLTPKGTGTVKIPSAKITPRVVTTTDDATAVIDVDVTDQYQLTAVANDTVFTVTGTPTAGQKLIVRLKDAGVAKNLTWTGFTARGATPPAVTVANKTHYVGFIYNATAVTFDCVAAIVEA